MLRHFSKNQLQGAYEEAIPLLSSQPKGNSIFQEHFMKFFKKTRQSIKECTKSNL